jgi:hypothetical protein
MSQHNVTGLFGGGKGVERGADDLHRGPILITPGGYETGIALKTGTAAALITDHKRKAIAARIPDLNVFDRENDATELHDVLPKGCEARTSENWAIEDAESAAQTSIKLPVDRGRGSPFIADHDLPVGVATLRSFMMRAISCTDLPASSWNSSRAFARSMRPVAAGDHDAIEPPLDPPSAVSARLWRFSDSIIRQSRIRGFGSV